MKAPKEARGAKAIVHVRGFIWLIAYTTPVGIWSELGAGMWKDLLSAQAISLGLRKDISLKGRKIKGIGFESFCEKKQKCRAKLIFIGYKGLGKEWKQAG